MENPLRATPFGVMLTAMITPFKPDGSQDLDGAQRLATHLVDNLKHDGIVVNGTTGESSTKSDAEDLALVQAVLERLADESAAAIRERGVDAVIDPTQFIER